MAIDSVSAATTAVLAQQTPLRPRLEEAPRTTPATPDRAAGESPDARRAGDTQGAVQPQRAAEVSDAPAATDGQTRPTLNTAGQTVGRIVDTTA